MALFKLPLIYRFDRAREALGEVEQQKANIDVLEDARLGDEGSELPALGEDARPVVVELSMLMRGRTALSTGVRSWG
jgi:hypothetical protein